MFKRNKEGLLIGYHIEGGSTEELGHVTKLSIEKLF